MALGSQQRGKIFERLVEQILLRNGFTQVQPDGQIIYRSASGLMLHGLGQPHNTDVLVDPPFQIPFFFPSRLIVECKCYQTPIGLSVLRNALGLREDINGFDIVTKEILKKRENYRRRGLAVSSLERFSYQVAVASISGFTQPAQEFALVHRIPLINIQQMPFCQGVRDILFEGAADAHEDQIEEVPSRGITGIEEYWLRLQTLMQGHIDKFCVGVLSSGDILFFYTPAGEKWLFTGNEIELHWSDAQKVWQITPHSHARHQESWFELPDALFIQWAEMKFDREKTLDMKEKYFKSIYVMGKEADGNTQLRVLRLSKEFIDVARENLQQEETPG